MSDPPLRRLVRLHETWGWRRAVRVRQVAAGLLAFLALALALAPDPGASGVPVVVAAVDVPAGTTLEPAHLVVREWPAALVPAGAVTAADAEGRVLVGAARAGEPLTDARVVGHSGLPDAALADGTVAADAAAVPVRLADADVAALVRAGSRVDVVTSGEGADDAVVLAGDARVVTVLPAPSGPGASRGPLVLVALPRDTATRVAAASLTAPVTITLR